MRTVRLQNVCALSKLHHMLITLLHQIVLYHTSNFLLPRYLRHEQKSLMAVSREAIFDSRVEWGPLPNFKSLKGDRSDKNSDKNNNKQAADKVTAEKPKGNRRMF